MTLFRVHYVDVDGEDCSETCHSDDPLSLVVLLEELADSGIDDVKVSTKLEH